MAFIQRLGLLVLGLVFGVSVAFAQPSQSEITALVRSIEHNLTPSNINAYYQFTNFRTDGTQTTYEVQFTIKDSTHSFGVFMKPEREKFREILRLEDAIWTYMPSVGRAVRVADRDSFAGGDFSNADVLRTDWTDRYAVQLAKETENQLIIDLTAKTKDATYAKMRLWVNKQSRQPIQMTYYDSNGTLLKRSLYGSITTFGKITRPARIVMENVITGQKSEMKVLSMTPAPNIPNSRFYVDNLGK